MSRPKSPPWRSSGADSAPWEEIRQGMNPRPSAQAFLRLCDRVMETAADLNPDWKTEMLWAFVASKVAYGPPPKPMTARAQAEDLPDSDARCPGWVKDLKRSFDA